MASGWIVFKDILKFIRRPKLYMTFQRPHHLRDYTYVDTGWVRRIFTMHVGNKGRDTAKRCVATIHILQLPPETEHLEKEYALHWAGVPYTFQTTGAEPVDIGPELRRLDVFFTDQVVTLALGIY